MSVQKHINSKGRVSWRVYVYDAMKGGNIYCGSFSKEREAKAVEAERRRQLQAGETIRRREQVYFRELARRWYAGLHSIRPSTKNDYWKALRRLDPLIGDRLISSLTRADLDNIVSKLAAEYSPSTTRKTMIILKMVLKVAVDWDLIAAVPTGASRLNLPRIRRRAFRPLTAVEVHRLLDSAPEYWRVWFLTAVTTGCRRAELFGLTWSTVDLERGEIHIQGQLVKGKIVDLKSDAGYRRIPIPAQTVSALKAHRAVCPATDLELVFPTPEGKSVDPSNWYARVFIPTRRAAGLPTLRAHDLRHQYASTLIRLGRSIKYVQTVLGHANASVTLNTYGWLMPGEDEEAVDAIEKWLSKEDVADFHAMFEIPVPAGLMTA